METDGADHRPQRERARAQRLFRYQIMLRTAAMSRLSRELGVLQTEWTLPEGVLLGVDIDPVDLS